MSVNLIGSLTPLGNPQNLFVYQRAGWNAGEFVMAMLPFVGWCTAGLIAALFLRGPSHEMKRNDVALPDRNHYAWAAAGGCYAGRQDTNFRGAVPSSNATRPRSAVPVQPSSDCAAQVLT